MTVPTGELWIKSALFYVPRLIATALSAFTADDKGWSLKKVLAMVSTCEAMHLSNLWVAPNNVIVLVLIWLIYAGILVGIYSISDIASGFKTMKGNGDNQPK